MNLHLVWIISTDNKNYKLQFTLIQIKTELPYLIMFVFVLLLDFIFYTSQWKIWNWGIWIIMLWNLCRLLFCECESMYLFIYYTWQWTTNNKLCISSVITRFVYVIMLSVSLDLISPIYHYVFPRPLAVEQHCSLLEGEMLTSS